MANTVIGKELPRHDAADKVTGKAAFAGDISFPGIVWGKLLLSPHPHARIKKIDTSRAESLPGVICVATHKDVHGHKYGEMVFDQEVFAKEKVLYVGDAVAAVAAADLKTAEEALNLIHVEYELLPPVLSPADAVASEAPLIHEEFANYQCVPPIANDFQAIKQANVKNLAWATEIVKGDVEAGFREADQIIEQTYTTPMGQAAPIEPRAYVAKPEASGKVSVWAATQVPFPARGETAHALGLPESKVRVVAPPVGGGFGAKCQIGFEPHAAALALKAGRPVKLVLTREEDMITANPRHPSQIVVKTGVKKDGTITAREASITLDTGYTSYLAPLATSFAVMLAHGPYRIPNVRIRSEAYYTNKASCSMVRAPIAPQCCFAVEQHTDDLAQAIGMDPLQFRMKNLWEEGDEGPTRQRLVAVAAKECLKKAAEKIGWGTVKPGPRRGLGLAVGWWQTAIGYGSAAVIHVNQDGTVTLITGATEQGSGSTFALAQIVAEELQVAVDRINLVCADTDTTPWDFGAVGSRTTFNAGHAAKMAAQDAKKKLIDRAGQMLEANVDDLEMKEGMVFVKGAPDKAVPVGLLAAIAPFAQGPLIGEGSFNMPINPCDFSTVKGSSSPSWGGASYFAQAAEVEVDEETGNIKVLKVVAAHDVGFAINPLGVIGQIEGGVSQGIGLALTEHIAYREGKMVNPSYLDFKLPLAIDNPAIEAILVESNSPEGPYGAKGVGEPPIIPTAAAIANALYHATGARVFDLPLTPERVHAVLRARKKRGRRAS